tara:strand:- start:1381 stop:2211 length:831 start_codon:yes stop_codon:yes gene_type:complete
MTRLVSWNVAGIRAKLKKGYLDFLIEEDLDVVCLQETKGTEQQIEPVIPITLKQAFPYRYWIACNGEGGQRKGLNGVSIWSRSKPKQLLPSMKLGINEGRTLALDMGDFIIVCVYTPNGQMKDNERFVFRTQQWDQHFRKWIKDLNKIKNTIVCGDFNVARTDIDIAKPDQWAGAVGVTLEERSNFESTLQDGWVDTFRSKHPAREEAYTYWNQKVPWERKANIGWRIDYFLVRRAQMKYVKKAMIWYDVMGSDHCPILLECQTKKRNRLKIVDKL